MAHLIGEKKWIYTFFCEVMLPLSHPLQHPQCCNILSPSSPRYLHHKTVYATRLGNRNGTLLSCRRGMMHKEGAA